MPLHQLANITMGVPDVPEVSAYYSEFGLDQLSPGRFGTVDGGEQLRIEYAPTRRLTALEVGVDDIEDLERVGRDLERFGIPVERKPDSLAAIEPVTGVRATLRVLPRLVQAATPATPY